MNFLRQGALMVFILTAGLAFGQSPHGKDLKISCASCHSTESWVVNRDSIRFDHDTTRFALEGQHEVIDCRQCHATLEFEHAESNCTSCHLDMHQQSVGDNCSRCHHAESWLVNNIEEIHRQVSFPLMGAHATAECASCHKSESGLRFDPMNTDCFSCHMDDYASTSNPEHDKAGFSTDCIECHKFNAFEWDAEGINHDFFPLTQGHDIQECAKCHTGSDYTKISTECITCHELDFKATTNPNHQVTGLSTSCVDCHTTAPGWKPAEFQEHDLLYFPIYSGSHEGEWDKCSECHSNPDNYSVFTCITCHKEAETQEEHDEVLGYAYNNSACLACHPTGEADGAFNHDNTNFPLTGAHQTVECLSCHATGFSGTPTECVACHTTDFDQSINPDHNELGLSTNCVTCHTTAPDWNPATFANHNDFYALNGAHAIIANQCATCHQGDYTNTPATCVGCHLQDYNNTTNPSHAQSQFSTDCASCHSENSWAPAMFAHDEQYFPIYSGSHEGEWSACAECHTTPGNFGEFTCITCHMNPETDDEHEGIAGYSYNSSSCFACHPTGEADGSFDHNATDFPLTGAHTTVECLSCHANGYAGTPTACDACHAIDFNQATNPNHTALGLPMDCAACHTTIPGWEPASFDLHNQYYVLAGAHAMISTDCASCHNGDYNNTPNTCAGCHQEEYDQTADPSHFTLQLSTECAACHNESAWEPAPFDHNNYYALQGAHAMIALQCAACHQGNVSTTPNTCAGCHIEEYNQTIDPPHVALQFSTDCASCHNESAWDPSTFDHDGQFFPIYSGDHQGVWSQCSECHTTPGNYSIYTCITCHTNPETDEEHQGVNGYVYNSSACLGCHPTGDGDVTFDHSATNFPLTGAHTMVNCIECHAAGYAGTPTACEACHTEDFNQSLNPNHVALSLPMDCASCHTTNPGWEPASFDIHNQYYVLAGAHTPIASQCATCHNGDYNNTPNTCAGCHQEDYNQSTNPSHITLQLPNDCASCHTESDWSPAMFTIHNNYYVLSGAHALIANECATCHNGDYNNTPNTCAGCHIEDYNQTTNPAHISAGFGTECASCHSEVAWEPANFDHDAQYFPIYSGEHMGVWDQCSECHTNPNDFSLFTCITCHANPETNQQHSGVPGYAYNSVLCLACHPTGSADLVLNHNNTNFPLTGAHTMVDCMVCHSGGFEGTPTECNACHLVDYNQSTNPDHGELNLSTDCASCHTTAPDWNPALFPVHNDYYVLAGAHAAIASQCAMCHNGDYNNTPNTCAGCHIDDYNQTNNPPHDLLNFSTDCASCHTESAWIPAEYLEHDDAYFPIYSGGHEGAWDQCNDCHTNPGNYSIFTCVTCHTSGETNTQHTGVSGYIYQNAACFACHPTGDAEGAFNHNNSDFPLTGAHLTVDCIECHAGGYAGTPTDCDACHMPDYNQSSNPDHDNLGLSTDCATCHTTTPDWNPALFPVHNTYYPLVGAHALIANQCATCHNGNYNNTPNTCVGCHLPDYNQTNDPDHQQAGFPTACEQCHTQTAWTPANWNHDDMYFPIYSGKHEGEWDQCSDCHTNPGNYSIFTCVTCHEQGETANDHDEVPGYQYLSTACLACHPDGEAN